MWAVGHFPEFRRVSVHRLDGDGDGSRLARRDRTPDVLCDATRHGIGGPSVSRRPPRTAHSGVTTPDGISRSPNMRRPRGSSSPLARMRSRVSQQRSWRIHDTRCRPSLVGQSAPLGQSKASPAAAVDDRTITIAARPAVRSCCRPLKAGKAKASSNSGHRPGSRDRAHCSRNSAPQTRRPFPFGSSSSPRPPRVKTHVPCAATHRRRPVTAADAFAHKSDPGGNGPCSPKDWLRDRKAARR